MSATQLLRIATAGSVDDGKSTLIGRLLYDSKAIFEDQLEAVEVDQPGARATTCRTSRCSPTACGPSASRASPSTSPTATSPRRKRKFIIADTPGHIQYTRNMVTGASTADVALILIDARNGVLEQSRRHAFLATLLGIPHLDRVREQDGPRRVLRSERFEEIREEFRSFAMKLEVTDLTFIPISALTGDNVVTPQRRHALVRGHRRCCTTSRTSTSPPTATSSTPGSRCSTSSARSRTTAHDFRGYAGTIAGGMFKPGDEVDGAAVRVLHDGQGRCGTRAASSSTRRSPARR